MSFPGQGLQLSLWENYDQLLTRQFHRLKKKKTLIGDFQNGTVTAGNASGINDGAAVLVLASAQTVADKKLTPRARVVGFEQSGVDPLVMGLGPITAVQKLVIGWLWLHV